MSSEKSPEVSVIITNYNYGDYLEQAINSVLEQTYENIKLFIVDDASNDNSVQILKQYADKATVIRHKKNQGIVYSRNEALSLAKSLFVLFLDADNWFNRDHVELLVAAAQKDNLDVVYCGMQYYIDNNEDMKWVPPDFNLERLKNENYIDSSSLMRRNAIDGVRFDPALEKLTHEDWDFFLSLGLKGLKFKKTDVTSLNYRIKSDSRNITNTDPEEKFANLYKYLYEKYNNEWPGEFGYLAYYRFVKSFLDANEKLASTETQLVEYKTRLDETQLQLNTVLASRTYEMARDIGIPFRITRRFIRKLRVIRPWKQLVNAARGMAMYVTIADMLFMMRNKKSVKEEYFIAQDGAFKKKSDHAIILHLYYVDNWEEIFTKKFQLLTENVAIDLYVTMPEQNRDFAEVIRKDFVDANIFFVPNRGRDVLPFIKVAQVLHEMGYKKVLKVHSKKSTHRNLEGNVAESGDDWLTKMMDSLIPSDKATLKEVLGKINDKATGMLGAAEYCYPLKMYLKNNRITVERIMRLFAVDFFVGDIANRFNQYSYFGGTMFWIDLDTIKETLTISADNFHGEKGQTDATTAHALERVFCLLPQIKGKNVYTVSSRKGIQVLPAENRHYPDWYFNDVSGGKPQISIIVPVYSDWWSLSKNITSLKKYLANSEDISVHYVNDCGPEADIIEKKIRENISGLTNFYYYRNEKNLGFVGTCNKAALELVNKNDDVLLLNSDTKVTKNFVVEMRKVLYSQSDIGAVTSRSNNATIWSVPMTSKLANYRVMSYLLYQLIKYKLPERYITPTIHGFCVLIRREVIDRYGLFDKIYGRGYGEENDFAMRLRKHGWKCAVANYSFVFHYESRSFGNETRNKQIEKNEKILLERYPQYRSLVQEYWDNVKEPFK